MRGGGIRATGPRGRRFDVVARHALAAALGVAVLLAAPLAPALAQDAAAPAPAASVGDALDRARASLEAAREAPGPRHPDAEPWRRALNDAQAALAAAEGGPREPEAIAALARTYGAMRWWSRALDEWERLEGTGAEPTADDLRAWREAASQVAFARYQAGDLARAAEGFGAMLDRDPTDAEALRWAGRIALERGLDEEALGFWTRLVDLRPDDESARYYAEVAAERVRYGREASDAFRAGLAHHEAGALAEALDAFETASAAAPGWREAAWWRARSLLEAGRTDAAVDAWEALAAAHPDDEDAAWFLERARRQARVGREAALAADDAEEARAEGDADAELAAWRRAVAAAPDWIEARLGLGRAALAAGDGPAAAAAYRAVLEHPQAGDDARAEARTGLDRAAVQERLGPDTGRAYVEALAAYERGDADAAIAGLRRVTEAAPDFAEAWGRLGRIAFARSEWATAAEAYERASELVPEDEDYAFFAQEARDLAGPE